MVEADRQTVVSGIGIVGRQGRRAMLGLRGVQQSEDALGGGHAVHRHVEERAKLTHGNKEFGGQQHNQQQSGEGERKPAPNGIRYCRP